MKPLAAGYRSSTAAKAAGRLSRYRRAAAPGRRRRFEIDAFDGERRSGWSVMVVGRLEEVTPYDAATLDRVHSLPVDPWAGGDKAHWMRLVPTRITGRRVGDASPGSD